MNPNGVNLTDVWDDIPPVRHWKFKSKKRAANLLSTEHLDCLAQTFTCEEDVALGSSGEIGVASELTSQDSE